MPRDRAGFGVIHGDFELDNLGWDGDTPVAYDFDEAVESWFVADIAYAVRDLEPVPARTPRPREALTPGGPDEAPWLADLRRKLAAHLGRQRDAAVAAGPPR